MTLQPPTPTPAIGDSGALAWIVGRLFPATHPDPDDHVFERASPLSVGDRAAKTGPDYRFEGVVQAVFLSRDGSRRVVVENGDGQALVFTPSQPRKLPPP